MKFNKDWFHKDWVPYTIATCSAVLLYVILTHINLLGNWLSALLSIVEPVIVGLLFAYLMDPIARFYERTIYKGLQKKMEKMARKLAVFTMVLTVLAVLGLFVLALGPQLVQSIGALAGNLGTYAGQLHNQFNALADSAVGEILDLSALTEAGDKIIAQITAKLGENLGNIINTSYSVGSGFVTIVIGFILGVYFLMDKAKLARYSRNIFKKLLKEERYARFENFCKRSDKILLRYIECDLLEGIIVGVANFIFMMIMGMPYAGLISLVVGVTNLAPTFGPIFGAVVGALILVLVNPWYMLWFLIFTVILQTIDGYVIKPKLFGDTLGVSSLWILIAIIVGGRMFGVAGILLAIPFAAIVEYVCKDILFQKNEE
ncbi:MAG: AI-2E family transporter [Candidatus Gastranaerophilales bacterium]|nr:AI-2E family transporter [Candidatus Gastranaerophilales bacterium]